MREFFTSAFFIILLTGCNNSSKKQVKTTLPKVPADSIDLPYSFQTIEAENLSIKAFNLKKVENFQGAIKVYNQAIKIEPNNPKLYFDVAECYARTGSIQRGIRSLDRAIEMDSLYAGFYNNRGLYYYNVNKNEEAIKDLKKAILLDSTISSIWFNLSISYYAMEKWEDACKAFARAQKIGLTEERLADQIEFDNLKKLCNQ